jgi:hypothetical protein
VSGLLNLAFLQTGEFFFWLNSWFLHSKFSSLFECHLNESFCGPPSKIVQFPLPHPLHSCFYFTS